MGNLVFNYAYNSVICPREKAERWHRLFSEAWKILPSIMDNHVPIQKRLFDLCMENLDYLLSVIVTLV